MLLLSTVSVMLLTQSCGDEIDLCEDIICQNGGACLDGTCDCPDGFTGDNCETEAWCEEGHWTYENPSGPEEWAGCYQYPDCGGDAQSPVDIIQSDLVVDNTLTFIGFDYLEAPIHVKNTGHSIELEYDNGSTMNFNGEVYELKQFHFHTPSEHTINGEHLPLEIHLVHQMQGDPTKLAVIALFSEEGGADNPMLATFIDNLPTDSTPYTSTETISMQNALNDADIDIAEYLTYSGSLTTPPCSEIVTWLLMTDFFPVSDAQVEKFSNLFPDNNRPVQPLNGRTVNSSF